MMEWDERIGISSANTAPGTAPLLLLGTLAENLKNAAHLGYGAVEWHTREDIPWDAVRIRQMEKDCGVKIAMLVTGRLATAGQCTLIDDRPYVAQAAVDRMKRYIDMAAEIQAGLVLGWVRGKIPQSEARTPYLDRLTQNLVQLDAYALERNVPLNLEVINRYEINIFNTAKETADYIRSNGLKSTFVHLDSFHMNIEETSLHDAILYTGENLGYFHIADNNRTYPGGGSLDFQPVFSALDEIGYQGFVTVECLPIPDHLTAAWRALKNVRKYMQIFS